MNVGTTIDGKYRVDAVLGEGGMGRVVAASHLQLGTRVAIKFLLPEVAAYPGVVRRFMREARAAGRLTSEHVCRIIDVGQLSEAQPYIVMEMLKGSDVAGVLRRNGPFAVSAVAELVLQALHGLAEAHQVGTVHRDLKPANLFIADRSDGTNVVKVLDFGIATAGNDDLDTRLTQTHTIMGSPGYMSPEQLKSARDVDARSDIWSMGVTMYEMACGAQPFRGESFSALSIAIATEPHRPLSNVSPAFAALIDRCLAKEPSQRFADVAQLASALAPLAKGGMDAAARVARALRGASAPPALEPTMWAKNNSTLGLASAQSTATASPRRAWPIAILVAAVLTASAATYAVVVSGTTNDERKAELASSPLVPADQSQVSVDVSPPDAETSQDSVFVVAPLVAPLDAAEPTRPNRRTRSEATHRTTGRTVDRPPVQLPDAGVVVESPVAPVDAAVPKPTIDAPLFDQR